MTESDRVDAERHRTAAVNERAQHAIADARLMVNNLNLALDVLDETVILRKGVHRAER